MTADAILPVGRDCECGQPMIWVDDFERCAVYGRHLPRHPSPRGRHPVISTIMQHEDEQNTKVA